MDWRKPAVLALSLLSGAILDAAERPLLRDFLGLNGHTVQFRPELYQPVARLVRDYHPVEWDLGSATSLLPPFPQAKNRVDWNGVYGAWRDKGWHIDVSLMFETVARTNWTNLKADARAYGEAFARAFGPSGTRRLVESVEVGNEPGKWSDADYGRMFRALAEGIRAGDPKLRIATCNLTTGRSGDYEKSVDCVAQFPGLFDVLTVHSYAQLEGWPTWRRSYPEDPRLPKYLADVAALCRWRDAQAPGKPVWVTEFGYDSSTQPAPKTGDFARWEGVTDEQQAQWLVRSTLVFSAMPVERAYIYFFDDDDHPALHASAGITRHFQPKPSFHALAHLQRVLGGYRFTRVVTNEPGRLRVHEYRQGDAVKNVAWAVWSPTGEGRTSRQRLTGTPGRWVGAARMPLTADEGVSAIPSTVRSQNEDVEVELTERPLYLFFQEP